MYTWSWNSSEMLAYPLVRAISELFRQPKHVSHFAHVNHWKTKYVIVFFFSFSWWRPSSAPKNVIFILRGSMSYSKIVVLSALLKKSTWLPFKVWKRLWAVIGSKDIAQVWLIQTTELDRSIFLLFCTWSSLTEKKKKHLLFWGQSSFTPPLNWSRQWEKCYLPLRVR